MNKYTLLFLSTALFALAVSACKNDQSKDDKQAATELPKPKNDSLMGFEGFERAGFLPINATKTEFKYQHHKFQILDTEESPGDQIIAIIDSTGMVIKVPDVEATYFRGFSRGHFFVDIGKDPYVRDIIIYSLQKGVLSQVYRTPYIVADTPFVANGTFWFFRPVEQSEVPEKFECPDGDDNVVFGQRYLYHMINRGLTRKSEYTCSPSGD